MAFEGQVKDFPEHEMSRDQLLARARQLSWYHTLHLDPSLRTEGIFDLAPYVDYYLPVRSLQDQDCFEIGSGNGFWSFEMERLLAQSVTTLDLPDFSNTDFSIRFGREGDRPAGPALPGAFGEPLRIAATLKGSNLTYVRGSVYDVTPTTHGTFDMVFCGSMLMHLFGPMLALQRMASICRDTFLITTQTDPTLEPRNLMAYLGHEIPYVHFVPSPTCLESMISSCGFERVLRGPTFNLRLRDPSNVATIPHTTFIALKDGRRTSLDLGQTVASPDVGRLSVVGVPDRVAPRQAFDVTVEVQNHGAATWLAPDAANRFTVLAQCDGCPDVRADVADYLPRGLSGLAVLKCTAPAREGSAKLRVSLWSGKSRVDAIAPETASITVRTPTMIDAVIAGVRGAISRG